MFFPPSLLYFVAAFLLFLGQGPAFVSTIGCSAIALTWASPKKVSIGLALAAVQTNMEIALSTCSSLNQLSWQFACLIHPQPVFANHLPCLSVWLTCICQNSKDKKLVGQQNRKEEIETRILSSNPGTFALPVSVAFRSF